MRWPLLLVLAACGDPSSTPGIDGSMTDADSVVDPTSTTYRETCDGSGAVALGLTYFLDVNDENQGARIYQRAMPAPIQTIDLSAGLGVAANIEVDLEDIEQIGNRVFMTASHGRKSSGVLDRARYKFAAFDLGGSAPNFTLTSAGTSNALLDQMLVAANWDAPNTTVIAALTTSSKLTDNSDASLAPELMGTNIEALANDGTGKLLIGFRNPLPGNKAIVVSLVNPDAALTGTARFGAAAELDLGGLGIRGMTYSPVHQAVLVIAGPHDGASGPFKLYKWSGALTDAATFVTALDAPAGMSPEAVVAYPNTKDVQIVFDAGDADINGATCKNTPAANRVFRDTIVTVD
jgi:Protein of unknown function (DUF3616)